MSTRERSVVSRIAFLEESVQDLSKKITAGAPQWDDTTRLAVDSSILAICGLLWGFTSLLHETSSQEEARKLTETCIRQLEKANLHAETLEELESTMISLCEEFEKQR